MSKRTALPSMGGRLVRNVTSLIFGAGEARRQQLVRRRESGRVGWVVLWLLGVPIPLLLLFYLLRGCT